MLDTIRKNASYLSPLAATLAGLVVLCVQPHAQAASIECWKNHQGVRECGNTVPPEYAQQRIEVINDHGIVIQVRKPAKTREELAEEARHAEAQRKAKARAQAQARRDRVLLDTFGSVNDITQVRDQKISALQGQINVTQSNIAILERNLAQRERRAADRQRAGRPVPQSLLDDMAGIKRQIEEKRAHIKQQQAEQQAVRHEYAGYIKRYTQLTGKTR